ncbi:carbohydrate ABC transporter permease [Paenibacillus sp. R14(2021)]|uniref:carbohydrate ABC transporter permease n=1 Tax=Paenibacillus sp. R14(2021) TaxID=2859228 RepID=UPI001C611EF1|nr:sugar ABC transporter permease [Paenibacillus sp. R14(2021)]
MVNRILRNPYVLIAPAVILVCVFSLYPAFFAVRVSFINWDTVLGTKSFVGFKNYMNIFHDPVFWKVMRNTLYYSFFTVVIGIVLAFLLGIFFQENKWVDNLVQSIIFTPHILSSVSITVMWMWLMDPGRGILNFVLHEVGLPTLKWMMSPDTSLMSIIVVTIWKGLGYSVMIVIAGLQSIPGYIYEAAKLDNAGRWTRLFRITLPLLSPTLFFMFITATIASFSSFDIVSLMTKGGPENSTNLVVYWIYQIGFLQFNIGKASAGSVLFMLFVSIVAVANYYFFAKKVHYQ